MAETNKKENVFARIGRWFREMRSELKKIVWPSKGQLGKNILTVLVCCLIVGVIIWVFDLAASGIYNGILLLVKTLVG